MNVGLVCMPFFGADCPSIQIGLLVAIARETGHRADTHHLNLELAAAIGSGMFQVLCEHRGRMTGDWLFSIAAFGSDAAQDDQPYFDAFPDEIEKICKKLDCPRDALTRLRHETLPRFIDTCAENTDWGDYDIVGFTSTFQQNVASLALARRIKQAHPKVRIVFGGANFEDEMGPEYVRAFPFIDYAVIGEADAALPELLGRIADGRDPGDIPGVVSRCGDRVTLGGPAQAYQDMDAQPIPAYEEYFSRLDGLGLADEDRFGRIIPIEGSRGCWWGAKHHCTFCGLNGLGMGYRSKRPDRLMRELTTLAQTYRVTSFEAVDNILDMKYLTELFPLIEDRQLDYTFFFEVKANLKRSQIKALQRGGVRWIQPGIESLSTHVLALMEKGSTMLQNLLLLKWARYYGIKVGWNIIWGFPGETAEDYARQLAVARLIVHLDPPSGCGPIWLERFSPFYTRRDRFPISNIAPERSYGHVYPRHVDLTKIAYFFEYDMKDTQGRAHSDLSDWVTE